MQEEQWQKNIGQPSPARYISIALLTKNLRADSRDGLLIVAIKGIKSDRASAVGVVVVFIDILVHRLQREKAG